MKPSKCWIMCPDCGKSKMQFETEKEAERFIKFNGQEISETPEQLRVYYCPACCCYHISSKPPKKSYEHRTEKLINAYHHYTEDSIKKIGEKYDIIQNIISILKLEPDGVTINKTGQFHIVSFNLFGSQAFGISETGETHNLDKCNIDELKSMLRKIIKNTLK